MTTTFLSLFLRKLPRLEQPTQGQGRSRISTALAKRMALPKLVQILRIDSSVLTADQLAKIRRGAEASPPPRKLSQSSREKEQAGRGDDDAKAKEGRRGGAGPGGGERRPGWGRGVSAGEIPRKRRPGATRRPAGRGRGGEAGAQREEHPIAGGGEGEAEERPPPPRAATPRAESQLQRPRRGFAAPGRRQPATYRPPRDSAEAAAPIHPCNMAARPRSAGNMRPLPLPAARKVP